MILNETLLEKSVLFDQMRKEVDVADGAEEHKMSSQLSLVSYLVTYIDIFVWIIIVMELKQDFPPHSCPFDTFAHFSLLLQSL